MRFVRALFVVPIALLALAGPASAADFYASPSGAGASCGEFDPCSLQTAMSGRTSADTVFLHPGSYGTAATPLPALITSAGEVHGVSSGDRPTVFVAGNAGTDIGAFTVSGQARVVSDLRIRQVSTADNVDGFGVGNNPQIDRVDVHTAGTGIGSVACGGQRGGAWTNTICASSVGGNALFINSDLGTTTVTNTTLVSPGASPSLVNVMAGGTVSVQNSILTSGTFTNTGATTNVSNSDNPGSNTAFGTFNAGTGNITDTPQFRNAAGQDYRQAADGPTVNKGDSAAATGLLFDVERDSRVTGAAVDMGADEQSNLPTATTNAANDLTDNGARLNGTLDNGGGRSTFAFEFGTTTSYGSSTPVASGGAVAGSGPVARDITGLTPGTLYHYRLVVTNGRGTANGADGTFTTTGTAPGAPGGGDPQPGGGGGGTPQPGGGGGTPQPGGAQAPNGGGAGGTGTGGPVVTLPSNAFSAKVPSCRSAKCNVTLTLPGAGVVTAADSAKKASLKASRKRVAKAGKLTLKLGLASRGARTLKSKGKLVVKVNLTFTPTGGKPASRAVKVTFRMKKG